MSFRQLMADGLRQSRYSAPPPLPRPTLGTRIQATPCFGDHESPPLMGTIVYVHNTHYYYTVEFDLRFRQSYKWGDTK